MSQLPDGEIYTLRISDNDGEPLVTIKPDGSIIYGAKYKPDIAARLFWSSIAAAQFTCSSCGVNMRMSCPRGCNSHSYDIPG